LRRITTRSPDADPVDLLVAERAGGGAHQRVRARIQVGDVAPSVSDHHRIVGVAGRPPVGDQAPSDFVAILVGEDPPPGGVPPHGTIGVPISQHR